MTFSPRVRLPIGLLFAWGAFSPLAFHAHSEETDVPKIAGTWTWTWDDPTGKTHRHVLEVEGTGTKLAAREIFDEQQPVKVANLTLDARAIKFSVVRGDRKADYSGKVADSDHINGTVLVTADGATTEFVWKAERRKDIPK
ncbi:MAG: hypothetical protein NVSMB9_36300 [Isosphaeraceae bacterium]